MIYLKDFSEPASIQFGMALTLGDNLFLEARNLFHRFPFLRDKAISVCTPGGKLLPFSLGWKQNLKSSLPEKSRRDLPIIVSDFWDYDLNSSNLDYSFADRCEVYIFDKLEEYSYTAAKILHKRNPERHIFFKDPMASFFFEESDTLHIISGDVEFYQQYRPLISRSVYTFSSKVRNQLQWELYPEQLFRKNYTTLELMSSLFWLSDTHSYGEFHPDKVFCVIRNPLGMEGLVDMIKYVLYRAEIISSKSEPYIPVVDLSVPGDGNQFNGGDGRNAWTMFFEQLTPIPMEEVYRSCHVVEVPDHLNSINPYFMEQYHFHDFAALIARWLRFSPTTRRYVERLYAATIPAQTGRILGVIGRGTDFNISWLNISGIIKPPSGPEALLGRTRKLMREQDFQRIFLATEDEDVFRTFMSSELAGRISFVDQPRVRYNPARERYLSDIYKEENRDGYRDNLRYLGIIYILSKCSALLTSADCGAFRVAEGLNNHRYEFTELYDRSCAEREKRQHQS